MNTIKEKDHKTVILVDDSQCMSTSTNRTPARRTPANRAHASHTLTDCATINECAFLRTPSAESMFDLLHELRPDLIVMDTKLPGMNGFDALRKIKSSSAWHDIPVVFLSSDPDEKAELKGLSLGATDYITKPISSSILRRRIKNHLNFESKIKTLKDSNNALLIREQEHQGTLTELQNTIIDIVTNLIEFRDGFTGSHIFRTQRYVGILFRSIQNDEYYKDQIRSWDISNLEGSVRLHDVGKIAISDDILLKSSNLTDEEYHIMRTHVPIGISIISKIEAKVGDSDFLRHARRITGTHHEKWDGTGYPYKLIGEDIPLEGRLMAIADVYDALVSVRPYKSAISTEQACRIIAKGAGSHFDPRLVEHFMKVSDQFAEVVKSCMCLQ